MSTPQWEQFLELIQQREVVPQKLVRHLHKQLQSKQPPPSARAVAGWLVDHGYLTRFQAQELLKAVGAVPEESGEKPVQGKTGPGPQDQLPEVTAPSREGEERFERAVPPPPLPSTPSLLDDLESLHPAGAELGPEALQAPAGPAVWGPPQGRRNVWESPLFLLGGGALILLLVIAGGLYWAIGRESADQLLQSAQEDYNNGAYTQAIEKFDRFLEYFPEHAQAGRIRVLRGLAVMRRAVEQGSDWEKTLQIVEDSLKEIRKEQEFPEARPELAALLPRVAEGLTEMAQQRQSAELLEKARRVYQMILNPNYVPDKLRNRTRLATLEGRFSQIERMLSRNRRLDESLQQIQQAIGQKQPRRAYEIRRQLLKEYPELETNAELQKAIAQATDVERQAIRFVSGGESASVPAPRPDSPALPMAQTEGKSVPEAKGRTLFVTAAGAVWALSAEDGQVRWRRHLGSDLWLLPTVIAQGASDDAVVWSPKHKQLWRLKGSDGSLQWHVPLPAEPVADPTLAGNELFVPVGDQLWQIDVQKGKVLGRYVFPQSLSAAPAVVESRMFLPGGHSNVYVIDLTRRKCVGAFYLGHEQDTVVAPPVVAGPFVLLAENAGQSSSRLRVLRYDPEKHTLRLVQSIRLQGQVFQPMLLQGRLLAVATDLGQVSLFEVNPQPQEKKKPLSAVASRAAVFEEPGTVQLVLDGAHVWIADRQLTRYRIQAAEGQMSPDRVLLENVSFPMPLRKISAVLFAVAQYKNGTVQVAAFSTSSGETLWRTRFATPVSWTPLQVPEQNRQRHFLVDEHGNLFPLRWPGPDSPAALPPRWSPSRRLPTEPLPRRWLPGGEGVWVGQVGKAARRLPVLRRSGPEAWQLRWYDLPEALRIPPLPWKGKLLLATDQGPVFVFDPRRGRMLGTPFFPPTVPGKPPQWLPVVAAEAEQAVLVARDGRIWLFEQLPEGQQALAPARTKELASSLQGPVVLFARSAWLRNEQGQLVRVKLPSLAQEQPPQPPQGDKAQPLAALAPIWGPSFCGPDRVLWLTRRGTLLCLGPEKLLWSRPFQGRLPVGQPVRLNPQQGLLAVTSGEVLQLDLDTGALRSAYRVGETLAGTPLPGKEGRVLVPTLGGALCAVEPGRGEKTGAATLRSSRR